MSDQPPLPPELEERVEAIRKVLRRLVEEYRVERDATVKADDEALVRIITGLATEAHDAAEATDILLSARLINDAVTAARRAFEHAVTAAWMAQTPGSVQAFAREKGIRTPRALVRSISKTSMTLEPELLAQFEKELPARDSVDAHLKTYERACDAFNPKLYVVYRLLSSHAHPSGATIQAMFFETDEDELAAAEAQRADVLIAAHIAATSLVWAGRALDGLIAGEPARADLEQAAFELDIPPVLYPNMPNTEGWPI